MYARLGLNRAFGICFHQDKILFHKILLLIWSSGGVFILIVKKVHADFGSLIWSLLLSCFRWLDILIIAVFHALGKLYVSSLLFILKGYFFISITSLIIVLSLGFIGVIVCLLSKSIECLVKFTWWVSDDVFYFSLPYHRVPLYQFLFY